MGMDELLNQLVERVGIDRETAQKVVDFLQEHATEVPDWQSKNETNRSIGRSAGAWRLPIDVR
jgi:hypothetical protein